jgi:solute carrier family 35, member F1/2
MTTNKDESTTLEVNDAITTTATSSPPDKTRTIFANVFTKKFLIIVLAGQFLSFCITATIVTNTALFERGANFPTTMSLLNYVLLLIVYAPKALYEKGFKGWIETFRAKWWLCKFLFYFCY